MVENNEEVKEVLNSESTIEHIEEQNIESTIEHKKEQNAEIQVEQNKENKKHEKEEKKSMAREAMEWIVCIVAAFFLALFIKYFIFTPTQVKMNSMYPTIFSDDRVFVNRLARTFKWDYQRGDIITFEAPYNSDLIHSEEGENKASYVERTGWKFFINDVVEFGKEKVSYNKRVIGVSGDKIRLEDGQVYVNDELLDESEYLPDGTITMPTRNGLPSEFVVPEGYIFAMGDNRQGSKDCRAFGCIPKEKVEGKVLFRIWPLNKFGKIGKSEITVDEVNDKFNY